MTNWLIKGGTVVDGSGVKKAYAADVRVKDGVIAEIGQNLKANPGEREFDAKGCYVTPGFIEAHTHYDATMWWQTDLDPLPGYGTTTIIMGNCGFSAAPMSDDRAAQLEMIGIFSFFEDIPMGPFLEHVPLNWRKWSEYRKVMEANIKLPANYAAFVGHIPIRLAVMGVEAWDRAATPDEIKKMAALLDDALAAGALGMSTNLHDHDGQNRPIPTLKADDAELSALFDVLDRYPGATVQLIVDSFMRKNGGQMLERLGGLLKGRKIRVQAAGAFPTLEFQKDILPQMRDTIYRLRDEGVDLWTTAAHQSPTNVLSIYKSLIFAQSNDYVWHEVVMAEDNAEKARLLADPEWRARARESWDTKAWAHSPMNNPQRLELIDSENGVGPINITLKDYMDQTGLHRSDAMADWILKNGVRSTVHMAPFPKDEPLTVELMRNPRSVPNISDAGAHLQMLCGGGENALLFTRYVRDEKWISVEEAVHFLSGKLAGHFGLADRGTLEVGKKADIVVFNWDEIERRPMIKAYDVPDGKGGLQWRFTREPMPTRLTMVNGEATFENGKATPARPGQFVTHADEYAPLSMSVAAE